MLWNRVSLRSRHAVGSRRVVAPVTAASRYFKGVNEPHIPAALKRATEGFVPRDNTVDLTKVSKRHWDESWSPSDSADAIRKNSMATWAPGQVLDALPMMVKGEGIYLFDSAGKKYIDLTSQAVCSNLGHTTPPSVQKGCH